MASVLIALPFFIAISSLDTWIVPGATAYSWTSFLILGAVSHGCLQRTQLRIRDDVLIISTVQFGVTFPDKTRPLHSIENASPDGITFEDGSSVALTSERPAHEMAALCDLINDAAAAHRDADEVLPPATRVDWGNAPKRIAEHHSTAAPLPPWASSEMHKTHFTVRVSKLVVALSVGGIFLQAVMVGVVVAAIVAIGFAAFSWWGLLLIPAIATALATIPVLVRWMSQEVHVNAETVTFENRLHPFTITRRSVPVDQIQGVSATGDTLIFYLGNTVRRQRCLQQVHEVEALAAHLNRLVTVTPVSEPLKPPSELRRVLARGKVRN